MLKHTHLLFVAVVIIVFIARVFMAQYKPEMLQHKSQKILPHVLATLLLLTGIGLVFQGDWLSGNYGWIVAKVLAMFGFIGMGMVAIKAQGENRWYAFAGAMLFVVYIIKVAITKQAFFFI